MILSFEIFFNNSFVITFLSSNWICYLSITSIPKGLTARAASLKCCFAKGIPMIVINKMMLEIKYSSAMISPPKISHKIFPKIFMIYVLVLKKICVFHFDNFSRILRTNLLAPILKYSLFSQSLPKTFLTR